jgi:mRNA interferase MazF
MLRRGEIWWARFDPSVGSEISETRPCVIISSTVTNERRRTVVVIPLSSSAQAAPPLTVRVRCGGQKVVAVIDQVRAISKERLRQLIENLPIHQLEAIEAGLREILELD